MIQKLKYSRETLTTKEFVKVLGVSPNTFRKQEKAGVLPKPLPLIGKTKRWSKKVVMDFVQGL